MKHLIITAVLAASGIAYAEPTTIAVTTEVRELQQVLFAAAVRSEEPVGLELDKQLPALAKLKLVQGDVIRTINGAPAFRGGTLIDSRVVYLDVLRGKQELVVRVTVNFPAAMEGEVSEQTLAHYLDTARFDRAYQAVTRGSKPSGVLVVEPWFGIFDRGDILRSVDGAAVTTAQSLATAFAKAKAGSALVVKLDRVDQALTLKVVIAAPLPEVKADPEFDAKIEKGIKKVDDTHYTIAKTLVDEVLANPMAVAKGARIVPAIKNGKPEGFKLYAIRPNSVYAKLGLNNGDTLAKINAFELNSAEKALEIYTKLREAKTLVIEIVRRGKPLTLTYTIR